MEPSHNPAPGIWKLVAAFAAFGLFWGGFAAALPAIKEATGTTEGTLGLALFCIPFCIPSAALPAMLLSGPWADRYGRRMLSPALAAFALVTIGPGLASSGLGLVPVFLALGITSGSLEGWSAIHLEDTLGASPAVGGLGPGLFMAAMVLGRVAAQSFGDRFKDTRLLMASGLVGAIGIELAAVAQTPWAALVGFWLAGVAISASAPTILSLTGRSSPPDERGTSMAAVTSIAYLGFFLSPAVVGGIADLAGLRVGLAALGGIGILLAVLAPRVGRLEVQPMEQASGAVGEPLPLIEGQRTTRVDGLTI
ncbi:hypothetical protein BH20ACT22_BH20ACT22_06310 [soil metagenome]